MYIQSSKWSKASKAMAPKHPIKQVILKKAAAPKPKASGVPEPAFPPASSSARPSSRLDASEKISSGVKGPNPLMKAYHHKKPSDPADVVSLIDCDTLVLGRVGESQDLSGDEKIVLPYIGVYHGHGLWNRRPMWKSAELGGDNLGLAPDRTCFLWYCQLYDVYCLSSSVHSDKSLSEPSFDWSTTTTLAWCSCDLKSFWCPWNAEEVSHVLGWRACYAFLCDKLVDYVRLSLELQELKEQVQDAQERRDRRHRMMRPRRHRMMRRRMLLRNLLLVHLGLPSIPYLHQSCQVAFHYHLHLQHHPVYQSLDV